MNAGIVGLTSSRLLKNIRFQFVHLRILDASIVKGRYNPANGAYTGEGNCQIVGDTWQIILETSRSSLGRSGLADEEDWGR